MKRIGKRALTVVLLALIASMAGAQDSGVASHPMIDAEAPPFDLDEVGGSTLSLESLRGRYVVLHFGASW